MDGYMSEIRLFGGNFAPQGYMLCQGQQMSIAQWSALYALLGTMYGGDGVQTFNLPDLRGRTPMGTGQGQGLSQIDEGEASGIETITLTTPTMPIHNHTVNVSSVNANIAPKALSTASNSDTPNNNYPAMQAGLYAPASSATLNMQSSSVSGTLQLTLSGTGGGQPFGIRSPYLAINFIICVEGIFPSRN